MASPVSRGEPAPAQTTSQVRGTACGTGPGGALGSRKPEVRLGDAGASNTRTGMSRWVGA